jgi:hypothetical protein
MLELAGLRRMMAMRREKCEDQYEDRCTKVYKIKAGHIIQL